MFAAEQLLTTILVWCSLSLKIIVDGSRQSCPTAAVVDLTGETRDSSGSVNKSGDVFPTEAIWVEEGKIFGCPCSFKKCVAVCCPVEHAVSEKSCIKDSDTLIIQCYHQNNYSVVHLFMNEPCTASHSLIEKYYKLLEDRLLHPEKSDPSIVSLGEQNENFPNGWLGVNVRTRNHRLLFWVLGCVNLSILFMLTTFIVYSVMPELKNLQGLIFRCYLASYICCMMLFIAFLLCSVDDFVRSSSIVTGILAHGFAYFGIASMMWLNVMSFDIWRTFRKIRPIRDIENSRLEKLQKKKFVCYSIFAWGGSVVLISSSLVWECCHTIFKIPDCSWKYILLWPLPTIGICNTCLYVTTALTIMKRKKATGHLINDGNKHHKENEQWFNLYVKLFVIMGGPLIFWAVAIGVDNEILWWIVYLLEAVQGISVFFIFVWKDDVKRLLRKRFDGTLQKLRSFFRYGSTSANDNQKT